MKLLIPLTLMTLMNKYYSMILISITIMFMYLTMYTSKFMMLTFINTKLFVDSLSMIMIMLTLISVILIIISSFMNKEMLTSMIPIKIILLMTFMSLNSINFYIFFELILIPTMILIMSSGKQPERLQASIYLIMYMILASLPLLISIISMNNPTFLLSSSLMIKFNFNMFMLMAFMVKMPMYFTHLWLPKAHVEAPLEGSMILAAVLLKLGGYGLIRFIPMCLKSINFINHWIISISLIGATATNLNCIRQKDLKSLIAYSSVSHMGFVLCGIMTMNSTGMFGAIIMMMAHGLSSSALFFLTNDIYMKYHSRNIMLFKGMILLSPNITFWWFMFTAMNISAPPSINTIGEIFLISNMINWNLMSMFMIFMMTITSASFSMMMFINLSHNKNLLLTSPQTPHKSFLSLSIHLIPLIFLLTKMEIMFP